jgi:subfamily B ATP-binding cassette protein MsbA
MLMQPAETMNGSEFYSRLKEYIRPYWHVLALAAISMVATAASTPMLAALAVPALDGVLAGQDIETMQLVLLAIIVLFAARGMSGFIAAYSTAWLANKLMQDLRGEIFDKLLTLRASYYAFRSSGDPVSKVVSDIDQLVRNFTNVATVMIRDSFIVVSLLAWMIYLNWKLSLLAVLMTSVIVLIGQLINERLRRASKEVHEATDHITGILKESIENYAAVKLYAGERYQAARMREEASKVHDSLMKRAAAEALTIPFAQVATGIAAVIIFYIATRQVFAGETTAGGFASLALAMLMLIPAARRTAGLNAFLHSGLAAATRIFSLLDEKAEPDNGTIRMERARGQLKFEHVTFRPPVVPKEPDPQPFHGSSWGRTSETGGPLDDIQLTIQPGEQVALIGLSASSKSTLAELILRFIDPTSGRILLDDHDIAHLTLASLRGNIALVSEKTTIFGDTVAANIAYGEMGRATEGRIMAAAQAAHTVEFVRHMPMGLQTVVGERGIQLSASQRLRVSIARALLKDAPILIFDEAAEPPADQESLHHVRAALKTVMHGRTTLIIARCLSTVEKADRVVMLHQGRISEVGRRELLGTEEAYTRLESYLG